MGQISKSEFEALLQVIATGLVKKIIEETGLDEDAAIEKLYTSELYAALEKESTKVWHYSVYALYDMLMDECATDKLTLPDF